MLSEFLLPDSNFFRRTFSLCSLGLTLIGGIIIYGF